MTEGRHTARPKDPADKQSGESAPEHVYAGGKFGRWLGRFLGGEGKRTGARDTDPGS